MPSCSLGPKWILTASPRSPSELGQINPSPKYYQSEAEAYYTLGKCHPFPLRGSALVHTDGPPLATDVLCNTRTQVRWALAGGLSQVHREEGNAPKKLFSSLPQEGALL